MKLLLSLVTMIITACFVSAFWLDYHANLQLKTKELNEEIEALLQERYEQRLEISNYHRQEIQLWREIARLKNAIKSKESTLFKETRVRGNNEKA